jgi:hypothetical protein
MGTANYDTTLKKGISLKNNLPIAPSSETVKYCKLKPNLAIVTGCARTFANSPIAPQRC